MHFPVLKKEVLEYLNPKKGENFIDCTFGLGGHGIEILKRILPEGKLLAIERDKALLEIAKKKFQKYKNLILFWGNFANLKEIVKKTKFSFVKGILFDLGMSKWHLEKSKRGFSFLREEPLVMKYEPSEKGPQAKEIVNLWPQKQIEKILREYGEEKFARKIAKEIIKERQKKPIETTFELVKIIKKATPPFYHKKRRHFATKTFQALRIAVNRELENLKKGLSEGFEVLEKNGKMVVISFHSLEDRIVKNFFKQKAKEKKLLILTKKPKRAKKEEILLNPSSLSAKLRAGEKL